jgi:RNA polymerase sigma factor (sigma-70 family)
VTHTTDDKARPEFERLFRDTRTDLLAYLVRRSETVEDAAELLGETYLVAWRKLDAIPKGDRARMWLFGVARNLLLREAGRRRSQSALVEHLGRELRNLQPHEDDDRRDPLRVALATLSEGDREILTLNAWENLTPKQIAAVMGISPNIVRVRLHRVRTRVKQKLALEESAAGSVARRPTLEAAAEHASTPARREPVRR